MNWIDKLERKYGKLAIRGLITYIIAINAVVFALVYVTGFYEIIDLMTLDPTLVLKGQIWRLITYIFIPPDTGIFWIIFALYFAYMVGTALEHEWGSFRFNLYYLMGMLGTTIAAFISGGSVSAVYLNLSLFLAFARIYPDFELLLFFILPVKVKYMAWLNWIYIGFTVISQPIAYKLAALASVINYFIFFGKDIVKKSKTSRQTYYNRKRFQSNLPTKTYIHKCTICGITEKDNPDMEFRYCSKCEGDYEYCMDHLKNHEHKTKIIDFQSIRDKKI